MRALPSLLLLTSLLLAGCGAKSLHVRGYEGQSRAQGQVALVTVPVQLEVFEVSGVPVTSPSLDRGQYTLEVPAGRQQLLVQYVESWTGGSGVELVRSPSLSLIADFRPGGRYRLDYPAPAHRDDALRFSREPVVTLVSADGSERVSGEVRPFAHQGLLGRAPGNFRPSAAPAPVDATPAPASREATQVGAASGDTLNRLKYWWEQATDAERQAFWQWIGSKIGR